MTDAVSLPLFPLGEVLFPGAQMSLHIFEERYRALMRDRLGDNPIFGVILTVTGGEVGDQPEIHGVGTAATLLAASELPDGRWAIVVEGGRRFTARASSWDRGYLVADVRWLEDGEDVDDRPSAIESLIAEFVGYVEAVAVDVSASASTGELAAGLSAAFADDLLGLTYLVAAQLPLNTWHRQRVLEASSCRDRYRLVRGLLRRERKIVGRAGATASLTSHPAAGLSPN